MNFNQENKKKKTRKIIIIIIIILLSFLIITKLTNKNKDIANTNSQISKNDSTFILDNYPIDNVPLKGLISVQSMKFFVNYDKNSFFGYLRSQEEGVNYYNVVYKTDTSSADFIKYYKSLMSEVSEEDSSETRIYGKIGNYKVSASNTNGEIAYIQVYLPTFTYENPYLNNFPEDLVEINDNLVEKENTYGLLNQNGGEIEYTKYFNLKSEYRDDLETTQERYLSLYEEYKQMYVNEDNLEVNDKDMSLKWRKDNHNITLSFVPSHGRVYLMIRKLM